MQPITHGRIVHYTCNSETAGKLNQLGGKRYNQGDKVPGIVVGVGENNNCNLILFPDGEEQLYIRGVTFSTGGQPGTWTWPATVGEQAAA